MNILIADDDQTFTQLLTTFLKAKGHTVAIAYDALQALATVMRTSPDVIVLDIMMPGGSGLQALHRLKASTRTNKIPVAVVSGSADPQLPKTVKGLGADEFLPKPVDFEELHRVLSRLTQRTGEQPSRPSAFQGPAEAGASLRDRPAIVDALGVEFSRAQREARPICVVVAEIDNFKKTSEVHGPSAGDLLFGEAARRIRLGLRPYDAVGKYDDGKFVMVLPGCGGTAGMQKAELLRKGVSEKAMNTTEGSIRVAMSLGVAATSDATKANLELLLRAAEDALDRARKAGGDRVELASELTTHDTSDRRKKSPWR